MRGQGRDGQVHARKQAGKSQQYAEAWNKTWSSQYAKSTAHVGPANCDTEGTARGKLRVEGGRDGKAGDSNSMPCMQKDVPHA